MLIAMAREHATRSAVDAWSPLAAKKIVIATLGAFAKRVHAKMVARSLYAPIISPVKIVAASKKVHVSVIWAV